MVQVIADVNRSKMSSHSSNTAQRLHVFPCSGPPASSPASAPYHQHHHDDLFLFLLVPLLVFSLVHLPPCKSPCKSSCKYTTPLAKPIKLGITVPWLPPSPHHRRCHPLPWPASASNLSVSFELDKKPKCRREGIERNRSSNIEQPRTRANLKTGKIRISTLLFRGNGIGFSLSFIFLYAPDKPVVLSCSGYIDNFLKRNYLSNLSNRHNVSRASIKPSTLLESNLTSYIFNVIQSPSLFSLLCPSLNVLGYTRHTEEKGYLLKKRSGEWIFLFIRYIVNCRMIMTLAVFFAGV